jgi:Negative regulator of sigma F
VTRDGGRNGTTEAPHADGGRDGIDRRLEESLSAIAAAQIEPPPMDYELSRELDQLEPTRTRAPRLQSTIVIVVSLLYGGAILAALGLRHDFGDVPPGWLIGGGALWAASFGALTWMVVVPPREQVIPRWRWAAALAVLMAIVLVAIGILRPDSLARVGTHYDVTMDAWTERGARCLRWGLTAAVVPVALTVVVVRGTLPVGSRWAAAAVGAAGGSLGGLMLHMHCPINERLHIGLAHGGVVIVAAVVAALLAPVGETPAARPRRDAKPDSDQRS